MARRPRRSLIEFMESRQLMAADSNFDYLYPAGPSAVSEHTVATMTADDPHMATAAQLLPIDNIGIGDIDLGGGIIWDPIPPTDPPACQLERPLAPTVDVTAESGYTVQSRLTSWITQPGRLVHEHLAGTTSNSELIHFSWNRVQGRWSAENLTRITGRTVIGEVTSWVTPDGTNVVDHIAGRDASGRLLVFYRSSGNNNWNVVDVTAKTGRFVDGGLTSWQTPNGNLNVEHIAARDAQGRLLVFWWSPARDWQVVDVTTKTGQHVRSDITSWQVRRGRELVEYLAAPTLRGDQLTVFSWSPSRDWFAEATGTIAPSGATPWLVGNVEHLSGTDPQGSLFVLWRNGTGAWHHVDVTGITGEYATGRPIAYQITEGLVTVELLAAQGRNNNALVYWWKPSHDWQAMDLTEITDIPVLTQPAAWLTNATTTRKSEHFAAIDANGRVRVFYSYDQPRTLTDRISNSYGGIPRARNTSRNVIAILWDPHRPDHPRPTRERIVDTLFGASNSVSDYFQENSGGAFSLRNAAVTGWYDADHPWEHYWNHPADANDGWTSGHAEKWAEAIRKADQDFHFASYDTNHDGTVTPDELGILIVIPQNSPFGTVRGVVGQQVPPQPLVVDGVTIPIMAEAYIGSPTNLGVVAHELSHLFFDLPDMYLTFFSPTAAGSYSLMDGTYGGTHLDPFNKLRLGWAYPRVIFDSGRYSLEEIEASRRTLVLMNPCRSVDEYFLIENRWGVNSYDAQLRDRGLAVWHIMENSGTYNAAAPPATVDLAKWNAIAANDWGRKGVRMVRPVLTSPFNDSRALWDAAEGNLLSTPSGPNAPSLSWGDGSPSGFSLTQISAPGATMQVTISVPGDQPIFGHGDINFDNTIDAADAAQMFANWSLPGIGDINGDGATDAADAGILFAHWTGDSTDPASLDPLTRRKSRLRA